MAIREQGPETGEQGVPAGRNRRRWGWCGMLAAAVVLSGCGRTMTFQQDKYINTACHEGRPPERRTGEPLELNIVVVYPSDLKKPGNELLRPGSRITAKDWYDRRPLGPKEEGRGRFDLPREQIYVLSNDDRVFGRPIGSALRGAALDGDKPIRKTGIALKWDMVHNDSTAIYVFPKFIDRRGEVLPVTPAVFCPPGAYAAELEVRIGVKPERQLAEAQYIQILSPRKLHR